jgi:hypothetical protein
MSIQVCFLTHLQSVQQYEVYQPLRLHSSESLFYGPVSCTRAHIITASMYKSRQYRGQQVQQHRVLLQTCTRVYSIVASIYKSRHYHGKHAQEYTLLWQARTRAHSIAAIVYKNTQHHGQYVQEHTLLC